MKVLVADPDPESRDALRRAFAAAGAQVRGVGSGAEGLRHLAEFQPEALVVALDLPEGERDLLLAEAAGGKPRLAVFALAPAGRLDEGVAAMDRGADDFLWRPVLPARVTALTERFERKRERSARAQETRLRLARLETAVTLPGRSLRWRGAVASIERLAAERAVLVAGEAGTEKEAAGRALHRLSPRGGEPFVISAGGEGFAAALERAGAGTLLVTGIDRAPISVQREILAVLARRNGPGIVLAADSDPADAVGRGELLADLVDRLSDSIVHLPPLRERGDDVSTLARHFLEEASDTLSFDAEAMDSLSAHDWPGNVAELKEVVRRAARLADGPAIGPIVVRSVLGRPLAGRGSRRRRVPVVRIAVGDSLADVERRLIQKTLEFARGNKRKTAELLKLSLKTIYNKIKQYGLSEP